MATFQVVALKPLQGISKTSQRPYSMLIVSGIFTNDDGSVELGEISFMQRDNVPLPTHLQPGQKYIPTVNASTRQGKLQFEIIDLKLAAAAAPNKPAAVAAA